MDSEDEEATEPSASSESSEDELTVKQIANHYAPTTRTKLERLGRQMSKFSRDTTKPSRMEEPAIKIDETLRLMLAQGADAVSRKSRPRRTRKRHRQQPETQVVKTTVDHDHPTTIGGLIGARQDSSVIQPAKCNREISAIRRPDAWIAIVVTVDLGACVTVVPIAVEEHIGILENALSREGFK